MSQRADSEKKGWINRVEFTQIVKTYEIPLKDASMDIDALFDILDTSREKKITIQTFVDNFESHIQSAKEMGHILEIAEVMKAAFDAMLAEPRAQRNRVNEAFLEAHHRMEQEHKGFGVNFWGSTWRFRLYEDLYSAARGPDGAVLPYTSRYTHLKERLAAVARGKDPWLSGPAAADPQIQREVGNWAGVRQFCAEWLALLAREEERDAGLARRAAEAAAARAALKAASRPSTAESRVLPKAAADDTAG
mmetsp:Transcript_4965/g.11056  ORF Transcript_4965/g.11056 Transcript_4965/m.11056 type:complete len:249 (-) Transcript_4965:139-885(-)